MSQTVSPPAVLTLMGPNPLPPGWTATLTRFDLDTSQAPAKRLATLRLDGPGGASFTVTARVVDHELWGLTPEEVAQAMWPSIQEYAASSIARLSAPPVSQQSPPDISVPVKFTS